MRTKTALKRIENRKNFKAGEVVTPDFPQDNSGCERQSADEFFAALFEINCYLKKNDLKLTNPNKGKALWVIVKF
jgi:hypothetical protein